MKFTVFALIAGLAYGVVFADEQAAYSESPDFKVKAAPRDYKAGHMAAIFGGVNAFQHYDPELVIPALGVSANYGDEDTLCFVVEAKVGYTWDSYQTNPTGFRYFPSIEFEFIHSQVDGQESSVPLSE